MSSFLRFLNKHGKMSLKVLRIKNFDIEKLSSNALFRRAFKSSLTLLSSGESYFLSLVDSEKSSNRDPFIGLLV